MDYWNDKDCPMWMIHLMVYLEWLLSNAFTLTTNYLCYIVSHCWPLWYAKLMFIVQTLLVSRKALLENKRQYSCSYSYPLLTIMIIDAKLMFLLLVMIWLEMGWICFQIMIKMSAFSSFIVCLFVCILLAILSGRVKRV